jgi:hypothetical protein
MPRARTTVICAVWHQDPKRFDLLRVHQANLDSQTVPVERLYVFDSGDIPPDDLKVRSLVSPEPLTIFEAWNLALNKVRTPYVMNLNLDDRLATNAVQVMEAVLDDGADIVCGDWRNCYNQRDTDAVGPMVPAEVLPKHGFYLNERAGPSRLGTGTGDLNSLGHAPLWRMSLHDEVGLFPTKFADGAPIRVHGDAFFWAALRQSNKKIARLPYIIGHYSIHPTEQAQFRYDGKAESEKAARIGVVASRRMA